MWVCCHSCSVPKSYATLCDPMDCSMQGFPFLHYIPQFVQSYVHWVGDTMHSSHLLSPPSTPACNLSQHQGLFQKVSSSGKVAKVLELQHQFFPMNIQGWSPLGFTGLIFLLSRGLSRVFYSIMIGKHQYFSTELALWPNSYIHTWLLENHRFDYTGFCQQNVSAFQYTV